MTITSDPIEDRLRRDLRVVASTVTDEGLAPLPVRSAPPRRRTGRRVALVAGALAIPVAVAAAAVVRSGPEYVDTIPADTIVARGSIDGSDYLLVESRRFDDCAGAPVGGVELVEESKNLLGSEWNTTGYVYGEPVPTDCGSTYDPAPWLLDPSRYDDSGVAVGDSFAWVFAVHPDVTTVRITVGDDVEDLTPYEVDGAGYAVYEVPSDVDEFDAELLVGDEVVTGTAQVQELPDQ